MSRRNEAERALTEKAKKVMPAGGTGNNTPFRHLSEFIVRGGRGSRVWDESGNEYIDFLLGSGPMLVGHAHPKVLAAVQEQIAQGTTFLLDHRFAILLAEAIVDAVPCADQVRFVSSGTEADAYAIRLVRAYRNRNKILKFEGGYHGMSDAALTGLGPQPAGNTPRAVPISAGIPEGVSDDVLIAPFNDIDTAASLIREYADELAGVLIEPLQRIIPGKPGFVGGLRELTAEHNIPFIFDEVVTGFRLAYGGAQEYYGVTPDLCTLGKACGGGYPLAAIAGREEIMAHFDADRVGAERHVVQVGTLSGNPVAAAAGLTTLEVLREPGTYERLFATGQRLMDGIAERLRERRFEAEVVGLPPCFDVVFAPGPIEDARALAGGDQELLRRCNELLLKHGILKIDIKNYLSTVHTDEDISQALEAWSSALDTLAAEKVAGR